MEAVATAVFVMAFGIVCAFTIGWVLANTGGLMNAKDMEIHYALPSESARNKHHVRANPILFWIGTAAILAISWEPIFRRIAYWLF